MADTTPTPVPKVHPATREILPDDPLEMHGFELPGDPDLMLRLLVEEYARIGWSSDAIVQLAHDPNYQAFHGLLRFFGSERLTARVGEIVARCGVMRVRTKTTEPLSERLVQIEITSPRRSP
jgi:hypothetical protein